MTLLEPVERYFDAWNSHDGDAIAACFDPDGGYTDPVSGRLVPAGITAYASGLFDAFPD
jgi:ketosteroid isomerase-like protein